MNEKNEKQRITTAAAHEFGSMQSTDANFLHDVRVEMKQVTWPSREDVIFDDRCCHCDRRVFRCFTLAIVE